MAGRGPSPHRRAPNGGPPRRSRRPAPAACTVVVDVGNTKVAFGLFRGDRLLRHGQLAKPPRTALAARRNLAAALRRYDVVAGGWSSVLSSVVPAATARWSRALRDLTGVRPLVLGADAVPGFRVRVPEPAT
ncbi:MAG: type III pantothenate kinase, partial [Thermoanaerobaculia bacterium]|nr:type III pantothenate kinase [Thermoanaerobaculia bacterium]